ncbi:MAG: LPS export ABC transporter permease LptG [Gammaproteobacteria bacterium]
MTIIDRYIAATVIRTTLLAALILASVAGLFAFMSQLSDVTGHYGVPQVALYVLLTLPRRAYELFPTAVLLGALMGLGTLAGHSELVVMRASGLSVARIVRAVLQAGLVLVLVAAFLGEVLAPPGEEYAQNMRAATRSGYVTLESDYGFWARDGDNFVNIRRVLPGARLENIYIYSYGAHRRLRTITHAATAEYHGGRWTLHDIEQSTIRDTGVTTHTATRARWDSLLDPGLLEVLSVDPNDLPALSLYRYVQYMKRNNLDPRRYQLAFWVKVVTPLSTLVMLLLALPFVFGSMRSASAGVRLLVGALMGLGFYLLNQALNYMGLVYGISPFLSALLPSLLFTAAGLVALSRVR